MSHGTNKSGFHNFRCVRCGRAGHVAIFRRTELPNMAQQEFDSVEPVQLYIRAKCQDRCRICPRFTKGTCMYLTVQTLRYAQHRDCDVR